jgi:hypothetical protein
VNKLKEAQIPPQVVLRNAPVRAQPRSQQGPKALHGVDVYLRNCWRKSAPQLEVDALIARYEGRRRFPEWRDTLDGGQDVRRWFDRP